MPTPVIIDTDPGVDDTIAILLALASPELEVLAYNVSYGLHSALIASDGTILTDLQGIQISKQHSKSQITARNILKIYDAIEKHVKGKYPGSTAFERALNGPRPILAKGPERPLDGEIHHAQYFHGQDGLGDISDRHQELNLPFESESLKDHCYLNITASSGVDVALNILRSKPSRSVTYIALGPLTNLALMMQREPDLMRERIGLVVSMGGALDVPGNTSATAEFNFFADPFAVRQLVLPRKGEKGLPLDRFLMLPLDITTPHELPFPIYKTRVDKAFENTQTASIALQKSPITHFTSSFLERTREIMLQFGKDAMELHDIVAVWCAAENPPAPEGGPPTLARGWLVNYRFFQVERHGEHTRGMLVVDRREDASAYPLGANRSEAQREPHPGHTGPPQKSASTSFIPESGGVPCIYSTPGPEVVLEHLLQRVWGVTPAS
ncbi:Inosine/uridine-preferring nucleoside hydrolase domain-containing protein [Panaeolus papilionaceus]|nr:Inosine/uridine-preferring nucleoside hydrolase domain-containing protein [Panaeolus papilionaceus]